jgi:hypothetical protein
LEADHHGAHPFSRKDATQVVQVSLPLSGEKAPEEGKVVQNEPGSRNHKGEKPPRFEEANGLFKKGPVQVVLTSPSGEDSLVESLGLLEDVDRVFVSFPHDTVGRVA